MKSVSEMYGSIKVMTFNIWNYNSPWPERRKLIADLIAAHQADVVALQETRRDFRYEGGRGQGDQLAELTGYHPTYALGQVYVPLLRIEEGLTTLTPVPPSRVMRRQLTMCPKERADEVQRVVFGMTMDVGGTLVDVYNTHFSLSSVARGSNARETIQFVEEESDGRPAILMGDLNAFPGGPPLRLLTGDDQDESAPFTDVWPVANPHEPGFTYSSWEPVRRIDYILVRGAIAVQSAELVGTQAIDGVYPSDHLGIVANLEL